MLRYCNAINHALVNGIGDIFDPDWGVLELMDDLFRIAGVLQSAEAHRRAGRFAGAGVLLGQARRIPEHLSANQSAGSGY